MSRLVAASFAYPEFAISQFASPPKCKTTDKPASTMNAPRDNILQGILISQLNLP
jgi:hypothetical protein